MAGEETKDEKPGEKPAEKAPEKPERKSFFERHVALTVAALGALISVTQACIAEIGRRKDRELQKIEKDRAAELQRLKDDQENRRSYVEFLASYSENMFTCGDAKGLALLSVYVQTAPVEMRKAAYEAAIFRCPDYERQLGPLVAREIGGECPVGANGGSATEVALVEFIQQRYRDGDYGAVVACADALHERHGASLVLDVYPQAAAALYRAGKTDKADHLLEELRLRIAEDPKGGSAKRLGTPDRLRALARSMVGVAATAKEPLAGKLTALAAAANTAATELDAIKIDCKKPLDPRVDVEMLVRHVDERVKAEAWAEAAACVDALRARNESGAAFRAYPDLVVALDRTGGTARARELLAELGQKAGGATQAGYLSGPHLRRLAIEMEQSVAKLQSPELKDDVTKTTQLLVGEPNASVQGTPQTRVTPR